MPEVSRAELKYLVQRQQEEIRTLNELGRLLSTTTEPATILHSVGAYLRQTFPVALCGIWTLEQRQLHLMPFAPLSKVEMDGALRHMRTTAEELLRRPLAEDECRPSLDEAAARARGSLQPATTLRSHVFAPLVVKGQTIGLLSLFSGQAEAFTREEHHAVGIIAEQLGAALRNAFLVQELRRADEIKDQLLSIVSHELGTPLTAIKEGVGMMLDGSLGEVTADQKDFLGTVNENADRLERLIDKVKTSAELITGAVHLAVESFDLRTILANLEKSYRALAALRQVHFRVTEFPNPLFWQVDPRRLTQAVSQLVENAIHATPPEGFVTLSLAATPHEAQIRVQDTGAGIPKDALPTVMAKIEQLPTLFDRFQSLGGIHDRKMGGLGLGLFIAKSLIEQHGGSILVESTVGEGTWMTVVLPKATPVGQRRDVTGRKV
jgi:signal transduction histidine kinase